MMSEPSERRMILIVDDAPENIDLLAGILCSRYEIKAAINGQKALRIANADPKPDLILLDILMPDMDGFEACRLLKAEPKTADIPVIFITGKLDVADEKRGFELGAVDYITRPLSPPVILARLKTQLQLYDQNRALEDKIRQRTAQLERSRLNVLRSEAHLRTLINTLPDLVWLKDSRGVYLSCNSKFERLYGVKEDKIVGKTDYDFVGPQFADFFREKDQTAIQTGMACKYEEEVVYADDGHREHLETIKTPMYDAVGKLIGVLGVSRDISVHRLEQQLQSAKMRLIEFAAGHSVMELLQRFLDEAEKFTGSTIGFFHFVEEDQQTLTLQAWSSNTLAKMCTAEGAGRHYPVSQAGVWVDCVHERKPVVHNDYASLPHKKGLPKGHAAIQRELVVPVIRSEKIVAILGVGNKETGYAERDVEIVQQLADLSWEVVVRKQAEEKLRESEAKYRSMMEAMNDAAYICSPDFRIEYMNPAMKRLVGRDATGQHCYRAIHDRSDRCTWCVYESIQQNQCAEMEIFSPKRNASYLVAQSPLVNENGSISKMTIYKDITRQKKNEEDIKRSERFLNAVVDNIPNMLFVKDANDLRFVRFNKAGEDLTGFSEKDLVGKNDYDFFPKEQADAFTRNDNNVLSKGAFLDIAEEKIQTKFNGERTLHTKKIPIFNEAGKPEYLLGISEDISERKLFEVQLRQSQKMESIGTLAGGIAHDFNNILGVIIGSAELLAMAGAVEEASRETLGNILAASQRAKELVRQILAFSRHTRQEKILLNLKAIIKETFEFLRASLPATIELRQQLDPQAGTVMADPTQMQQILMNLCTNAAHAMENTGGVLTIQLSNVVLNPDDVRFDPDLEPGGYARLTVADTGYGIAPEILQRIFDPYFTTKEKGKGTGLGLAVVHGIVKAHGGAIQVSSELGRGTSFRVFLPATEGHGRPAPEIAPNLPRGSEKILLVDDEMALADVEKQMLTTLGYQVEVRTSPIEALEAFRSSPDKFDLVLTDMTMPQLTGLNLSRHILEIRPGTPIVLCTGFSEQTNEQAAAAIGIQTFLLKPIVMENLAVAIRKAIDGRKNSAGGSQPTTG